MFELLVGFPSLSNVKVRSMFLLKELSDLSVILLIFVSVIFDTVANNET